MPIIRYVLYARKSQEDKSRQIQSIGDQIRELRQLAARRGLTIVEEIREERSAKAPGRPLFNRMLELIRQGEAEGILVWGINRLLRNPVDQGTISWMLQCGEIASLVTMDKEYLPGDNVVLLSVESAVANQYILDLRKVTVRGLATKVENGWYPHQAPLGYLNDRDHKTIIPDPVRFPLVRHAWEMLLSQSHTVSQILETLNGELGFRTPSGGPGRVRLGGEPLARTTLYRLFSNPFYTGRFLRNGILHQGAHPAMVTLEEFALARRILGQEKRKRPVKHDFAFAGLMRCGQCGGSLTAETHTKTLRGTGQRRTYIYYRCCALPAHNIKRNGERCDKRGINEEALIAQLDALLARLTIPPEFKEWGLRELERWQSQEKQVRQSALTSKQAELLSLNQQLDTLLELRLRAVIGDQEYEAKRGQLVHARDALQSEVEQGEEKVTSTRANLENVLHFCNSARAWFASGEPVVRRQIAQILGTCYELHGREIRIEPHPLLEPILRAQWKQEELTEELKEKIKKEELKQELDQAATKPQKSSPSLSPVKGVAPPVATQRSRSSLQPVRALQVYSDAGKRDFELAKSGSVNLQGGQFSRSIIVWQGILDDLRNEISSQELTFPALLLPQESSC